MIASLSGKIMAVEPGAVTIDVSGVGYRVFVPAPISAKVKVGRQAVLLTHMVVREDSIALYGFLTADQREAFRTLIALNGVGPKLGLAVLSAMEPEALRRVVATSDAEMLRVVPGIGKRGAERMILELKERIWVETLPQATSKSADVREALINLGYTPAEVREVLDRVVDEERPVEELVRSALKELART